MAQTGAIIATSTVPVSCEALRVSGTKPLPNAPNILVYVLDESPVIATAEPTAESDVATVAITKFDVLMDFSFEICRLW